MDVLDPVLESALEQELRGEMPSELSLRSFEPLPRNRPWRSVALVLLALSLVVAVWWRAGQGDRTAQQDGQQAPVPWHENLVIPQSVDEVMAWLGEHDRLEARVFAVRDPSSGRLVEVLANPFWGMFGSLFGSSSREPRLRADRDHDAAWTAEVTAVIAGPRAAADAFAALPLELMFHLPKRGNLVVGVDDTIDPVRIQVRGLPVVWTVARSHPLPAALRANLERLLADYIETGGLALGRDGLDALPDTVTSIRAVSLRADDLTTFARFAQLATLDLTLSPTAVTPTALRALAGCPLLRSVVLPPTGIGAGHLAPIVALPKLSELFVGDPWRFLSVPTEAVANEFDDRCAALLAGAKSLRELFLPFTTLSDAGVARLAVLPLSSLTIGSPRITGSGFTAFAGHQSVRTIGLVRCPALDVDGLRAVGAAGREASNEIAFSDCAVTAAGIAAVLSTKRVRELSLLRCTAATSWSQLFSAMATAGSPNKLVLNLDAGLRIDDLSPLGSAQGFERLEMSLTGDATTTADVESRLQTALPGVHIDVYRWPR